VNLYANFSVRIIISTQKSVAQKIAQVPWVVANTVKSLAVHVHFVVVVPDNCTRRMAGFFLSKI
jgi:hypothetical protein